MNHDRIRRETKTQTAPIGAQKPIDFLAIEKIALRHRSRDGDKCPAHEHGRAGEIILRPLNGGGIGLGVPGRAITQRNGFGAPTRPDAAERLNLAGRKMDRPAHGVVSLRGARHQRGHRARRRLGVGIENPPGIGIARRGHGDIDAAGIAAIAGRLDQLYGLAIGQDRRNLRLKRGESLVAAILADHDLKIAIGGFFQRGQAADNVAGVAIAHDHHRDPQAHVLGPRSKQPSVIHHPPQAEPVKHTQRGQFLPPGQLTGQQEPAAYAPAPKRAATERS